MRVRLIIPVMFILVLLMINTTHGARFALLVGNSRGGSDVSRLHYIKNDLMSLSEILDKYCGFTRERTIILHDKTPEDLNEALTSLEKRLVTSDNNLLLFYYSGHADKNDLKMGAERFPLQTLKDRFTAFPASIRIGIFDACQSGHFTRLKGGILSEPFLFKDDNKIQGLVILSSSSPTENAQESDLLKNSIFTFHLVNGLRGSADMSGDRKVTLAEAYQYSYNHTVLSTAKTWGGTQHPSYKFQIQGEGDIVLADLNMRNAGILLQKGINGDITVQDRNGNIVADLTKEKTSTIMIALDPGDYSVYRNESGKKWRSKVKVGTSSAVLLNETDFNEMAVQKSRRKGNNKRYTSLSLGISAGYHRIELTDLDRQTALRFNEYGMFGISPLFNFPYESFVPGVTGEVSIRNRYLLTISLSTSRWKDSQSISGAVNNSYYSNSVNLAVKRTLSLYTIDIGAGYHHCEGILKGLSGSCGVSFVTADYTINSVFDDKTFDFKSERNFEENGMIIIPFLSMSYSRQLTKLFTLGINARYRYQRNSALFGDRDISGNLYAAPPTYSFDGVDFGYKLGGIELSAYVLLTLRLREVKE